jgi:hypothetical protein
MQLSLVVGRHKQRNVRHPNNRVCLLLHGKIRFQTNIQSYDVSFRYQLTAEAVNGPALSLEGVNHIYRGDGLPPGVLRVGNTVTNQLLEKFLEDTASFVVYQAR